MLTYEYSPEVKLLLVNQSEEKVNVTYNLNPYAFPMPKIGLRPPYYTNPRVEPYYPVI